MASGEFRGGDAAHGCGAAGGAAVAVAECGRPVATAIPAGSGTGVSARKKTGRRVGPAIDGTGTGKGNGVSYTQETVVIAGRAVEVVRLVGRLSAATLYCCDCLPLLGEIDCSAIVTDPPYGMNKADWDDRVPDWISKAPKVPTAVFCGVVGMRDYSTPDWVGAWVRQGSTQRIGKLRGFNNWEPILFYNMQRLENDVIMCPNYHKDFGHPSVKPDKLMLRLVELMPDGVVFDPFMGTGTTGVACVRSNRGFVGVEKDEGHFRTACSRIWDEMEGALL